MAAPPEELEAQSGNAASASVSPNGVSDQPTRTDMLGFKPYVEAVAVFLTHAETHAPLTMSVEGAWGSGKSSFMLQLEDRIREKGGKTVWFNAWRHDKEDELWAAFALDFTSKLAATIPRWRRWWLHLKLLYLRFDWRRGWFQVSKFVVLSVLFLYVSVAMVRFAANAQSPFRPFFSPTAPQTSGEAKTPKLEEILLTSLLKVGGLAGYLLLGFALIRKVAEVIGNPMRVQLTRYLQDPKYEARATFVESFHADFDRLVRTYAEQRRVFVFIDDLDRCEVPKAAELMQALNLLISESAPVFYILGLDREKIAAGLAAKYEKLLPYLSSETSGKTSVGAAGTEFGYTYLEKFIQMPFLVPQPADKDVDKLMDSLGPHAERARNSAPTPELDPGLLVSLSSDSDSVRDVVKMVAPSLDYNPRRLKQFVNLFRLRALLASQTGLFGPARDIQFSPLTFEQLGKLVAIILRWPLLLVDVAARPDLLGLLQTYTWAPKSVREVTSVSPRDSALEFWLSKRNLIELISFPVESGQAPSDEDKARFGLHRIDIERFLQVSPMVRGRESVGPSTNAAEGYANPPAEASQHAAPRTHEDAVPEGYSGSTSSSGGQNSSSAVRAPDPEGKPIFGQSVARKMKK